MHTGRVNALWKYMDVIILAIQRAGSHFNIKHTAHIWISNVRGFATAKFRFSSLYWNANYTYSNVSDGECKNMFTTIRKWKFRPDVSSKVVVYITSFVVSGASSRFMVPLAPWKSHSQLSNVLCEYSPRIFHLTINIRKCKSACRIQRQIVLQFYVFCFFFFYESAECFMKKYFDSFK